MLLTIFTPTYNRAHTLKRTFESLCSQKIKDFEWLVVDDGSTDETEHLVRDLNKFADFPVRYFKKENGGKHTAYNLALEYAEGQLFFVLDSDDTIPADFVCTVSQLYAEMAGDDSIGGAIALISDHIGNLRGIRFADNLKTTLMTLIRKGYIGEYAFIFKTVHARRFRFPVIESEKYMPLRIVYDMFEEYHFLAVNKILTIREYHTDGLSYSYNRHLVECPLGFMLFHKNRYLVAQSLSEKISNAIAYCAFRHIARGKGLETEDFNPVLVRMMSLPGTILAWRFKKNSNRPLFDKTDTSE